VAQARRWRAGINGDFGRVGRRAAFAGERERRLCYCTPAQTTPQTADNLVQLKFSRALVTTFISDQQGLCGEMLLLLGMKVWMKIRISSRRLVPPLLPKSFNTKDRVDKIEDVRY
jgi:hypothetical protein